MSFSTCTFARLNAIGLLRSPNEAQSTAMKSWLESGVMSSCGSEPSVLSMSVSASSIKDSVWVLGGEGTLLISSSNSSRGSSLVIPAFSEMRAEAQAHSRERLEVLRGRFDAKTRISRAKGLVGEPGWRGEEGIASQSGTRVSLLRKCAGAYLVNFEGGVLGERSWGISDREAMRSRVRKP